MKYRNIEAERARNEISQQALSKMLGVSTRTIQNWQMGKTGIPVSKICLLADMWDCSTDYLLGLSAEKKRSR